ncbi:UDP-glucose 4-epimerase [Anaerocolumna cellulosilytica]|uniref:UDP-glucose 4-epimerase n=1 Tax=Anaerocolumna cellulosilytica TaxID=433286 RepID=A0A6S6QPV4_9FIRM|nr:NAD-dependent epimerase/dehydratase family protein [Anaerocolumna cellulosilytica]MBB5194428.1 UDP-glucose 4-epimerase [Anaerocolumna cellulosilytica]BCJ93373.1 UDP-glucose 4-epimerase [Anaerocolumna cellulosilytica]
MKKVLVIGANSYIGKKFNEYVRNSKVLELQVDMVTASDGGWRKVDFSSYDSILHLAAIVHKKEKKQIWPLYDEINHKLAVEVAKKAKENQVGQFIFLSTAAVFGNRTSCITKDTIPDPVTYYGKSKLAAENDIVKLKDKNFKVAIVRPPMVYGEGCKGNYARLEKLARFTPIFPDYHNKRSVIHIEKLIRYLNHIIKQEKEGYFYPQDKKYLNTCKEIYNIRKKIKKKTLLIKTPIILITSLINHVDIVNKMLGNMYYDESL